MPDKILTCQNCKNSFVYSEYEQNRNAQKTSTGLINQTPTTNQELPQYCPICASIKASEAKHPPKPQKI